MKETIEIKNDIASQKSRFLKSSRELKGEVKKLERKNRSLKKENKNLLKDKNRLEKENENLNRLNQEILNSTSWKVTKPLRSMTDKIRR